MGATSSVATKPANDHPLPFIMVRPWSTTMIFGVFVKVNTVFEPSTVPEGTSVLTKLPPPAVTNKRWVEGFAHTRTGDVPSELETPSKVDTAFSSFEAFSDIVVNYKLINGV